MRNYVFRHMLLLLVASVGVVACAAESTSEPDPVSEPQTSVAESALTCTPNSQRCEPDCTTAGGPIGGECRVACAPNGQFWITLEECAPGHCQRTGFTTACVP